MGLLTSRLTARRFVVGDELPDDYRESYRERLNEFAFVEPPNVTAEEVEGWTHIDDMMDSDFTDFNKWYVGEWMLFALRIDKRTLPAAKFRAELKVRCQAWCEERGVERCPASVRSELKELLEQEWLPRQMPKTTLHEIAWNIHSDMLYLSTHAEGVGDRVRKRFFRTFGRRLSPMPPMFWVEDASLRDGLLQAGPTIFGGPR